MATGSGKTFTTICSIYRLLKHAKAKRIIFLVDTRNLGEQAEQEFLAYTPNDDNRKFTELYSVQRLAPPRSPATPRSASPPSSGCISSSRAKNSTPQPKTKTPTSAAPTASANPSPFLRMYTDKVLNFHAAPLHPNKSVPIRVIRG